jgi:tyrosyl-tRNA synthetase
MSKMTLSQELAWRGFVNQTTFSDITDLDQQKRTFYWGVDPSAASMQIGNLAAAMMARVFIKHGYTPVLLVGGATGLIGDPDGKAQERDLKTTDEVTKNKQAIAAQYKRVFNGLDFKVVDNFDWFKDMNYLDFLRDVGKHVPMRQMLARDFVQSRLGEDGAGISYAEFSYSLIQGYDFLHLFEKHDVTLQLSGADQWGNSITGVDLIRRKTGEEAHVWTIPLIVNKATGVKFGKTEGGAVWLDAEMTSVYQFYQFWLNVDDDGVEDYLKVYTELDKSDIDAVVKAFKADPAARSAQKCLAKEVTTIVHGQERAESAEKASAVLFGKAAFDSLNHTDIDMLKDELTVVQAQDTLASTIVKAGLAASNSEANRFIVSGAISINGEKVLPETGSGFSKGANLLKRGKNSFAIIEQK